MSIWKSLFAFPRRKRPALHRVEGLEDKTLLSINIVYDYTYDTSGFFADYERKAVMEAAARLFEDAISDSLTAISAGGVNTWSATFDHPTTGASVSLTDLFIPADEIKIYLGARALSGSTIGFASSGFSWSGTSAWGSTVEFRGQTPGSTEFATWGGSITFDPTNTWHTGITTDGLTGSESDLYTTALHELGHILGFGGDSWDAQVSGGVFTGSASTGVHGSSPGVTGGHWADGLMNDGREVTMSPSSTAGLRGAWTTLDWAGLDDIGWTFMSSTAPAGHMVVQVVDSMGDPVSGASVSGTKSGGGTFSGTTDANGLYSTFVADGSWTVTTAGDSDTVTVSKAMAGVRLVSTPVVNGDDVILRDASTGRFRIGFSDGSSFTEDLANVFSSSATWDIVQGDFNGDGKTDVAGRLPSGHWWVGKSDGTTFKNELWGDWGSGSTWSDVSVGDFNGDGKDDIAGRDGAGYWTVSLSTGTGLNNSTFGRWASSGWLQVVSGDFNGDGKTDMAGRYTSGDWFFGISSGTGFTTTKVGKWSTSGGWKDVVAGDFDGDGKDDVAGQTSSGYWWIGKSSGTSISNVYSGVRWSTTHGFHNVLVGDFNGDGKVDIAGRIAAGNWFINKAKTTGVGFTVSSWGKWSSSLTFHTVVGDFNGDGKDDLAGFVASNRYWFVLQSDGTSFTSKIFDRWASGITVGYVGAGTVN
ncbi:MAG: FG-GAP-like repeat-containing protein [Planctomycetaceae bacterium]